MSLYSDTNEWKLNLNLTFSLLLKHKSQTFHILPNKQFEFYFFQKKPFFGQHIIKHKFSEIDIENFFFFHKTIK